MEEGITRRLQALGLNDGTVITVLNRKKNGALIIRVRGTRLAIGKHISQGIEVEEKAMKNNHTIHVAFVGNPNCGKTTLLMQ